MTLTIDVDLPADLEKFRLPVAVQQRLDRLLDQQDSGSDLSDEERQEAEGLVDLAEFLTLLRMRSSVRFMFPEKRSEDARNRS